MWGIRRLKRTVKEATWLFAPNATLNHPVFVTGTARSNTTYLAQCLNEHPDLVCPSGELSKNWELSRDWEQFGKLHMGTPHGTSCICAPANSRVGAAPLDKKRIHRRIAWRMMMEGGHSSARLLNHNPHLTNKLPWLFGTFSDATVIFTTRDIRSTVASLKKLWISVYNNSGIVHWLPNDSGHCWSCGYPNEVPKLYINQVFPGADIEILATYWLRMHMLVEQVIEPSDPLIVIRHRDFVIDPVGTLNSIANQLDLTPYKFNPSGVSYNQIWCMRS